MQYYNPFAPYFLFMDFPFNLHPGEHHSPPFGKRKVYSEVGAKRKMGELNVSERIRK
jgi:hypothetical protein